MKIKKPSTPAAAPAPAGGAIINDRLKLDIPPPAPAGDGGSSAFAIAGLVAALLAIALLGGTVIFLSSSWGQAQLL
ncbi:MAG: hypothetical protein IJ802_01700 [Kiritimatiellae bacterium]|nr:hypothetical protein [Kiritimatiellia bacterium]